MSSELPAQLAVQLPALPARPSDAGGAAEPAVQTPGHLRGVPAPRIRVRGAGAALLAVGVAVSGGAGVAGAALPAAVRAGARTRRRPPALVDAGVHLREPGLSQPQQQGVVLRSHHVSSWTFYDAYLYRYITYVAYVLIVRKERKESDRCIIVLLKVRLTWATKPHGLYLISNQTHDNLRQNQERRFLSLV